MSPKLIAASVLVVLVLGFGGWFVWHQIQKKQQEKLKASFEKSQKERDIKKNNYIKLLNDYNSYENEDSKKALENSLKENEELYKKAQKKCEEDSIRYEQSKKQ